MKKKLKHYIDKLQFKWFCKRHRRHVLKVARTRCNIIYICIDILLCGNEFIDNERAIMIKALEMYKEEIKKLNSLIDEIERRITVYSNIEKDNTSTSE